MKGKALRTLKWILAIILIVIIIIVGWIVYSYYTMDVENPEVPTVSFAGQTLEPVSFAWHEPVAKGLLTKSYSEQNDLNLRNLKTFITADLPLKYPEGIPGEFALKLDGETVFSGDVRKFADFEFARSGDYEGTLILKEPESKKDGWGTFNYQFEFFLDGDPEFTFSAEEVLQGDIITVQVDMGIQKGEPSIATDLGSPVFIPLDDGLYEAYVPVNYNCEPGTWSISVSAGEFTVKQPVQVNEREYAVQHMTMSQSTISATVGASNASENWEERMTPLIKVADKNKYWEGEFLQPCQGRISSKFGLYRYTNNNPAVRHTGIDIACPAGTPIAAANNGRVILSEHIVKTGNTVVIEHGGGLKTYYFHMSENLVEEGDMVEKGDIIALVGSTGYSTGPHLHFEVKHGNTSLSPWELFDGTSPLFLSK